MEKDLMLRFKQSKDELAYEILNNDKTSYGHDQFTKEKYLQDVSYSLDYLLYALQYEQPKIFTNYMLWFGELAQHLKFNPSSMKTHFTSFDEIMNKRFTEIYESKIKGYLESGFKSYQIGFKSKRQDFRSDQYFLDLLLNMKSKEAKDYIDKLLESGHTINDIYLNIFQPTLYRTGELWQYRDISVAKEHYITAMIQNLIGHMYPKLFANKNYLPYKLTAVCAGKEFHEIGMRMISDYFELAGWDTLFLGSNIPINSVIKELEEHPTHILAISATTAQNLNDVDELIKTVKKHKDLKHIKIIVGGRLFNETPELVNTVDADGYAKDVEQAYQLCMGLVTDFE